MEKTDLTEMMKEMDTENTENTEKTVSLMETENTENTRTSSDPNDSNFIASGSYGCGYKKLSSSELPPPSNETTDTISELLKCTPPTNTPPDGLENTHTEFMNKIQFIELNTPTSSIGKEPDFTEHRIVKETQYGETIKSIPNYYMYFAPVLSSCPMDIAVLSTKDRMKCEVFREMSTPSFREKDKAERMYVNSKIQFVEGTSLSSYFRKILQGDGVGQELSPFFVTRFIRSYRHLLKAVRLLQAGATSNSVIIHHDLKDGNIMYDTKRGVPIIIDFGISFDRSVFDESTHPKKLGNVFYKYFNRYAPWSIDVVILAYIAKVVLLRNGEGDDSIKEIYEKETIAVDDLKKVCDDFFENNEILKWVDTLTGGNNNTVASPTPSHNTSTDTNPNPNPANTDINAAENTNSNPNPANTNINAAENTNPNPNPANTDTNASTSAAAKNDDKVAPKGVIDNIKNLIFGSKNVETSQTGSLNKDVDGVAFDSTRNKMKSQWNTYIDSFNRKVWKELVVDLSQRYASWDVYSLSVCYLQYIHQLELLGGKYQVPDVFMEFVEELKTVF